MKIVIKIVIKCQCCGKKPALVYRQISLCWECVCDVVEHGYYEWLNKEERQ